MLKLNSVNYKNGDLVVIYLINIHLVNWDMAKLLNFQNSKIRKFKILPVTGSAQFLQPRSTEIPLSLFLCVSQFRTQGFGRARLYQAALDLSIS